MSEGNSLINLGDLTKPATTLIEKIADATGVLFEPKRIVRLAKAEAEAELIKAQNQIQLSEIQKRALLRFVQEEGKRQENLENIMGKTVPLLSEGSEPEKMDDDWIVNFFDKARLISHEDMQTIWAKILAGQANEPFAFSKRTVNLVATMDKADAEMFTKLCRFTVNIGGGFNPMVYDWRAAILADNDLSFNEIRHLSDIGLIALTNVGGYSRTISLQRLERTLIQYFDETFHIVSNSQGKGEGSVKLSIGKLLFTQSGAELLKVCDPSPISGFLEYVFERILAQRETTGIQSFEKI